ncbi:MAG TPA: GNAT family N-acetyltransferase [Anaerolineae bacterium]|nr:GNAT family N-acetyltransferase [Anaerolineae bacterium]
MKDEIPLEEIKLLLERDRDWCAYALADLYPPHARHSHWYTDRDAVLLIYRGLQPPILFGHGDGAQMRRLFDSVPPDTYQYGLLPDHLALLEKRLERERESVMWRMALAQDQFPGMRVDDDVVALEIGDLRELLDLFDGHPDQPDSFDESQLAGGFFFGIRAEGKLLAVAGTHVVSPITGVAALGNIFTHPAWRRRGYSRRVTAALVDALLRRDFRTIVLNVAQDNHAALGIYRNLGFWPVCGYHEGVGHLK